MSPSQVVARAVRLIAVALTLGVALPAGAATVKVLTYNTHHGGLSTTPTTTDGQLDTMAAQNPDIVVLQEPYKSQLGYYVKGLNSRLGTTAWHGTFGDNCKAGTAPTCTTYQGAGVMILTRLATLSVQERLIWAADDYLVARATIQMLVATADGTTLNVFVCHLPALSDARASRDAYVTTFKSWAQTFPGPQLVGGDFNDHPGTSPILSMTQQYDDAWAILGSGYGYTHPASIPTTRIDYWFSKINGGETLTSVKVIPDATDSDHRPVVATYGIKGSTATETTLLQDGFDTLDTTKWPGGVFTGTQDTTVPVGISSGTLKIGDLKDSTTGSHYNGISSLAYDLTSNGSAYVQLVQSPSTATPAYAMFAAGSDGSNFYRWYESGGALVAEKKIAGAKTPLVDIPYDPAADQFLRIRNEYNSATGGFEVVFETAPNNSGVPGSFTVRYREAWDGHVKPSAIKFELKAGTSDAVTSPGSARWDTFRAVVNTK